MENTCGGEDLAICMQSVRRQLVCPNENTVVGLYFFTVCHLCLIAHGRKRSQNVIDLNKNCFIAFWEIKKLWFFFSLLLNLLHSHPFLLRQGNTWGCRCPYTKKYLHWFALCSLGYRDFSMLLEGIPLSCRREFCLVTWVFMAISCWKKMGSKAVKQQRLYLLSPEASTCFFFTASL